MPQLQFRSDLTTGKWNDIGSAETALSNEVLFDVPVATNAPGFYRLKLVE